MHVIVLYSLTSYLFRAMYPSNFASRRFPIVQYSGLSFMLSFLAVGLWERYSMVFEDVWAASAFKGATGPCAIVTDIGFHVENHRVWLRTIKDNQSKFKSFRGIAITGWQRFVLQI